MSDSSKPNGRRKNGTTSMPTDTIYGQAGAIDLSAVLSTSIQASQIRRRSLVPYLEQVQGPGAPALLKIEGPEVSFGRDETSTFMLKSPRASRHHAIIVRKGEDTVVKDLGSQNGILLNTVRIHSAILYEGDIVQMAEFIFIFHEA